jgi:PKD repeat protein
VGITRYTWSFYYDGRARELEGRTASWRFDFPGEYQVTLMAYDEAGNFDTDVMRVTVRDSEPPVARFWSPEEGELGTSVVLDASGSDDNIGVTTYEWRVTHKGTVNNMTGVMVNFPVNTPGVYKVTLTVRDAAGNEDTEEASIYVPPKATVTETPGWLVPAMVVGVAAAVLVGWLVSRRYVGRNGT